MTEKLRLDPWSSVEIGDYEKVFTEFGVERITEEHKKIFKHHLFQRNLVIGHRDLGKIVHAVQHKEKFYCMTGIACSGPLHFGHKTIFDMVLLLKKLGGKIFFAVADLDGYLSRPRVKTLDEAKDFAVENLSHALALGFSEKDVYVQSRMPDRYYSFSYEISKKITPAEFQAIYGTMELGKISAVMLQIADILHPQIKSSTKNNFGKETPMQGIVPIGIDQDPHIRATRDICNRIPYRLVPPSSIYLAHEPGLREGLKMSSSEPVTAIFLGGKLEEAKDKVMRAVTGGRGSVEEQKRLGGEPEKCKVHSLLKFHHPDEKFVKKIFDDCKSGKLLCGDCKKLTADFVTKFLKKHQAKLKKAKKKAEKIILN